MSDNEKKNITLEDWNNFFKCIRPVFEKQKTILEEKRKRGDLFNVFSILNVERKEVRHSAFLSALLDPNGKHGLGNKFLSDFIKNIVHQQKNIGLDWDCNDVYVNTEEPTDEKDGFMDIYLKSKGKIIIVENKIDAKDGEKQLIRYDNHARTKGDNHCLLYLTLNGQCANEISTDSKNTKLKVKKDYFPISYRDDILPWLERCLKIATQYPRVRETIAQYIDLIKKLTNTEDMSEDIITNTLKDENIDTIAYLLDKRVSIIEGILKHIGRIIMNDKKLKDIEWDDIDIIYEYGCQYPTMLFRPKGWKIFWFALYHDGRFGIYNAEISNANKPLDEEGKKYDEAKQHASNLGYFCILKKITFGKLELKGKKGNGTRPFGEIEYKKDYTALLSSDFIDNIVDNISSILTKIKDNKSLKELIEFEGCKDKRLENKIKDASENLKKEIANKLGKDDWENISLANCFGIT